ncbi:hypothetical protein IV203_036708 [Nitzschia inconspicua]|uniref:Uncharacterized protein n=1 Tax=Nitzschia inconspicua TaxID=303405 RepID=A0A9K3LGE7_9STRA|nr:hypothetical protein IV203_036708 [Nitzschia inconspicua]
MVSEVGETPSGNTNNAPNRSMFCSLKWGSFEALCCGDSGTIQRSPKDAGRGLLCDGQHGNLCCEKAQRNADTIGEPSTSRPWAQALLRDFENRWRKATEPTFLGTVEKGARDRQVGIHPAFLIASFLDPRSKDMVPDLGPVSERVAAIMFDLETENREAQCLVAVGTDTAVATSTANEEVWNWRKEDDFFADLKVDQDATLLTWPKLTLAFEPPLLHLKELIEKRRNHLDPELAGKMLFVTQNWDLHEKHLQDMLSAAAEQQEWEEVQGSEPPAAK